MTYELHTIYGHYYMNIICTLLGLWEVPYTGPTGYTILSCKGTAPTGDA